MAQGRIEIKFKAKGDKALILAIKHLDDATKQLKGQTSIYRNELKKLGNRQKKYKKTTLLGIKNNRLLGNSFATLRSKLLLISFAIGLATMAFKKLLDKTMEQEKAEKKLQVAFGKSSKALINQASALQQVTAFGDENIINAQALIAAYTDDEEAIKKATEATLDLAVAKGMDLKTAADLVGKSFGSSTNALSRYGIEVRGVAGSTKRLESLTTNVARLFGGQARAETETLSGAVSQLSNAFGDANETLGELFIPFITKAAKQMKLGAERTAEWMRELRGDDMDNAIRKIEKLGANADEFRLSLAQSDLGELQNQLKGIETLEELQGKITANTEEQIDANTQVGISWEHINKGTEDYLQLQENASRKVLKFRDYFIGGKWAAWLDKRQGFDRQAEASLVIQSQEAVKNINSAKNMVELKEGEGSEIQKNIKLREKEARLIKEIELLQKQIAEAEGMTVFQELWSKVKDFWVNFRTGFKGFEDEIQNIANITKKWSDAVFKVSDAYIDARQKSLDTKKAAALAVAEEIQSERRRAVAIEKINEDFAEKQKALNEKIRDSKLAQTMINTAVAVMEVWADKDLGVVAKLAMSGFVVALGDQQIRAIKAQQYAAGGYVGGSRHSQGGTMIEAEKGEFVVSRKGVDSVGLEALNRINAGAGGGSVNVTFQGNILSKDFIEDEAIPQIKEALRRGGDIGVS